MRKKILLIFIIFLIIFSIYTAEIRDIRYFIYNGRLKIEIELTENDITIIDVYDGNTKKLIYKLLNTKLDKRYREELDSLNVKNIRAAQNNPSDVWLVVEFKNKYLKKNRKISRQNENIKLVLNIYVPKLKKKRKEKPEKEKVAKKEKNDSKKTRDIVTYQDKELDMNQLIYVDETKKDSVKIKPEENILEIKDDRLRDLLSQNKDEKAIELLKEYVTKYPKYSPYFYEKIAMVFYKNNDYIKSRRFFKKAYKFYEKKLDKNRVGYFLANVYSRLNKIENSNSYLKKIIDKAENENLLYNSYLLLAKNSINNLNGSDAINYYKRALNITNNKEKMIDVMYKLYKLFYEQEKYSDAVNYLEKLKVMKNLISNSRLFEIYLDISDIYYLEEDYNKALSNYMYVLDNFNKNKDWVIYQIGNIYYNLKKKNKSKEFFSRLINKYPDSYWTSHARIMMQNIDKKEQDGSRKKS